MQKKPVSKVFYLLKLSSSSIISELPINNGVRCNLSRLQIKNAVFAIRGLTAGHFNDKGERITLVLQPQLAIAVVGSSGIHKDASLIRLR